VARTQQGRSRIAFARYKGQAENALRAMAFPRVYIFRPAYIYPVEPRREPNFSYRLLRAIYPVFRLLFPQSMIPADDLARAIVDVAFLETREAGALFSRTVTSELWPHRPIPCGDEVPSAAPKVRFTVMDTTHVRCIQRSALPASWGAN